METTSEALRNLYVAFGGDVDDVKNLSLISDLINAIAEYIEDGGTRELPAVSVADNGKVLTARAGKWVKATVIPTVTAADNGKVLKVINGAWDKGTDETSAT